MSARQDKILHDFNCEIRYSSALLLCRTDPLSHDMVTKIFHTRQH